MKLHFLLSLLLTQSVLGQSVKLITDEDKKEIRLLATNRLEGFKDLLNTIAFEDATESQRNEVALNSYLPSNAQLFYNDAVRIEDDLNPEKSDSHKELPVVDYLKNIDLFYAKSIEPSIIFSNVVVSDVLSGDYTYVKVVYTSYFKNANKTTGNRYLAVQRMVDMRAEKVDKKWVVLISNVAFFNSAKDKIVMYTQPNDNLATIIDLYQQAIQLYDDNKLMACISIIDRAETLSAKPDAKLLYLKIKSLYTLNQTDKKYTPTLEKSFSIFKAVAENQNYSPMKIREVVDLQQQFDQTRKEQEKADFERAKASIDLTPLKLFVQQYPNSSYKAEELLSYREANRKTYEEQNELLKPDFARAALLMRKKSTAKIIVSTILLAGGIALCVAEASSNKNATGYRTNTDYKFERIDPNTGIPIYKITTTNDYYDHRSYDFFYTGGALIASSFLTAFTRSAKKKGKILQNKTLDKQRELQQKYFSFAPKFNLQQGTARYELALRFKF